MITISTPQFGPDGHIMGYVTQSGWVNIITWTFYPSRLISDGGTGIGMHKVVFGSYADFLGAIIFPKTAFPA